MCATVLVLLLLHIAIGTHAANMCCAIGLWLVHMQRMCVHTPWAGAVRVCTPGQG